MHKPVVALIWAAVLVSWTARPAAVQAQACTPPAEVECMTNYTCQTQSGFTYCTGEPAPDGMSCTHSTDGCSTGPFECMSGECKGTVPVTNGTQCDLGCTNATCQGGVCTPSIPPTFAEEGTPCSLSIGGSKCHVCQALFPGVPVTACTGTKTCDSQPADPCKQNVCNDADGSCVERDKCPFVSFGCETCNAGTCEPVNVGQPCATSGGCNTVCAVVDLGPLGTHGLCAGAAGTPPAQTPTITPTVGPSPTTSPTKPCVGDCNHKHQVTVDNLITMAAIMLGDESVDDCPAGDENNDQVITIDEEVTAEKNAISGCP